MYSKIQITGVLETKTGMHIGGSSAFAAIGAVDSPVIKDIRTNKPMVPGRSLKGKIRSLLARNYDKELADKPDDDAKCITRLFGSAKKDGEGKVTPSRIIVSDMFVINSEDIKKRGVDILTEVKFENTISRQTAVANPRQIERVIRGTKFECRLIYDATNVDQIEEDFETIREGLRLLEYDYLGGHGSRGYGKVKFEDLEAEAVVGDIEEAVIDRCNDILKEV